MLLLSVISISWQIGHIFHSTNSVSSELLNFFARFSQHVTRPTHGGNTLDLVLSTNPTIFNVSILPPFASSVPNINGFDVSCEGFSSHILPKPNFLAVDYSSINDSLYHIDWLCFFENHTSASELYH